MRFEAGYVPPPAETYKGIYRESENENWEGWDIIDNVKKTRTLRRGDFIISSALDNAVKKWYKNYYIKGAFDVADINSQTLADMVFDFYVNKRNDAIKVINYVAKTLAPTVQVSAGKISSAVINVMNYTPDDFYKLLKRSRIAYYNDPAQFGSRYTASSFTRSRSNLLARTNSFPDVLID